VLRPTEFPSKEPPPPPSTPEDEDETSEQTLRPNSSFMNLGGLSAFGRLSRRSTGDSTKSANSNPMNLDHFPNPSGAPTRQHWKVGSPYSPEWHCSHNTNTAHYRSPITNPLSATTRRASDTLATSRAGTTAANAATYSATCTAPLRSPSTRTPTSTRAACPAVHVATVTRSSRNGAVSRMHNPPPASLPTEAAILTPPLHPSPRPLLLPASASRFPPRSPTVSQETGI
jgi:hypothetical protein